MRSIHPPAVLVWLLVVGFLVWDTWHAPPVNLRLEPPLIAAGSGQSSDAGHCAMAGNMTQPR